jgi:hypothetical protein
MDFVPEGPSESSLAVYCLECVFGTKIRVRHLSAKSKPPQGLSRGRGQPADVAFGLWGLSPRFSRRSRDDEYEDEKMSGRALRLASAPAAHQIDRGAQLQQRVIGRLNPVYSRNRIKDDFFLLRGVIFDGGGENHLA